MFILIDNLIYSVKWYIRLRYYIGTHFIIGVEYYVEHYGNSSCIFNGGKAIGHILIHILIPLISCTRNDLIYRLIYFIARLMIVLILVDKLGLESKLLKQLTSDNLQINFLATKCKFGKMFESANSWISKP